MRLNYWEFSVRSKFGVFRKNKFFRKKILDFSRIATCGKFFLECVSISIFSWKGLSTLLLRVFLAEVRKNSKLENLMKEQILKKKRFHPSKSHLYQCWRAQSILEVTGCLVSIFHCSRLTTDWEKNIIPGAIRSSVGEWLAVKNTWKTWDMLTNGCVKSSVLGVSSFNYKPVSVSCRMNQWAKN